MIRKLKRRFIALAMGLLTLLLALLTAGMNVLNYSSVTAEADAVLDALGEPIKGRGEPLHLPEPAPGGEREERPRDGRDPWGLRPLSPETPYESRYFTVTAGADGTPTADVSRTVSVDADTARAMAARVLERGRSRGFDGSYRYAVNGSGDGPGGSRVTFLDCGRRLDAFRRFLFISCGMALAGLLAAFLVFLFTAERIVSPIAESYEKQRRFITDAGHEMRTPLTVIKADLELLRSDPADGESLEDAAAQAQRLAELTEELVALSRMEEERTGAAADFPVSDTVTEAASAFRSAARARGITLEIRAEPLLTLHGDARAVERLVTLLTDNAVKYCPDGGSVRVCLEKKGKNLTLWVENDVARPLSREELDHLFDRFYRADPARSSGTVGGHGIGLSVARAIVSAHRGTIRARMEETAPPRFRVTAVMPER